MQSSYYADSASLVPEQSKEALHYVAEYDGHLMHSHPVQQSHTRDLAHSFLRHVDGTIYFGTLSERVEMFGNRSVSDQQGNEGCPDHLAAERREGRASEATLSTSPAGPETPAHLQLVETWTILNLTMQITQKLGQRVASRIAPTGVV